MGFLARRQIDDVPMTHAALSDDVIGKMLHVGSTPFKHCNLHAALLVEMHVQRRLGEVVMLVEIAGKPLWQLTRFVIVDIDQGCYARPRSADLHSGLLKTGAGQIADRLGAVVIAPGAHEPVKFGIQIIINSNGHTLHRRVLASRLQPYHVLAGPGATCCEGDEDAEYDDY
jgi:hypothetical protein